MGSENGDVHTAESKSTKLVKKISMYDMAIACILITESKVSQYTTAETIQIVEAAETALSKDDRDLKTHPRKIVIEVCLY